ncbi:MAG: hypothetical protein CMK06_02405 [Ponticaulis sp.]|nr:hypothetical protein [Ponticaulis sp.]
MYYEKLLLFFDVHFLNIYCFTIYLIRGWRRNKTPRSQERKDTFMKTITMALVVSGLALAPAATAQDAFPFVFQYDAQTVQSEDGAQDTYNRLKESIEQACKGSMKGRDALTQRRFEAQCVNNAMEAAVEQISSKKEVELASR